MKINCHCHTQYSDGAEPLSVMLLEHQKQGFSAFVVTDHLYPIPRYYSRSLMGFDRFLQQRKELLSLSKYHNYPCIQGVELKLGSEEVAVFGYQCIKELFERIDDDNKLDEDMYKDLIDILAKHRKTSAVIWVHPRLTEYMYPYLERVCDGYETHNRGMDWMEHMNGTMPEWCQGLKTFKNSDAHCISAISTGDNEHTRPIKSEEDLIAYIKGRRK